MFLLPEEWDYPLKGLSIISKEGVDAIREAIRELESAGYIVRSRSHNGKGQLGNAEYVIYEQPQPMLDNPTQGKDDTTKSLQHKALRDKPVSPSPTLDEPILASPTLEKPILDFPTQANPTLDSICYCGVIEEPGEPVIAQTAVGTYPWRDLFRMDVASLPASAPASQLDRTGWAVVSNPDPADRLHLRRKPDRAAESLGKFYNRTPVQVLSQRGDWTQVRIGLDGRLEGWMLTKYLTFGEAMEDVACASPTKDLLEEHRGCELFASPNGKETTGIAYASGSRKWIAGVIDDKWYILLDTEGNTGYLPQS